MTMKPDKELLQQYTKTGSEEAFTELVRRHLNLVHSSALRQVAGDAHLARDVAQNVFTDLARHAASLSRRESLTGWLYTSTHFAAAKIVRTETRRRLREEEFMREPNRETSSDADWHKLRPILDAAMHGLKNAEREAVLLRYFENQPYAEVGAKLGVNENTARMRVERALEKLRALLAKRGITTGAALAGIISANAVETAPGTLAAAVASASITGANTGGLALFKTISATKLKFCAGALAVGGAAIFLLANRNMHARPRMQSELAQQLAQTNLTIDNPSNAIAAADDPQSLLSNRPVQLTTATVPANVDSNSAATAPFMALHGAWDTNTVINVEIRSFCMPEENLQALRPAWPSPASGCGVLTSGQFEFVRKALRSTGNFSMSQARITAFSGQNCGMVLKTLSGNDTNVSSQTVFHLTPYFSQESSTFRLDLEVDVSRAVQGQGTQWITTTNQAAFLPGQTAVLQKDIPAGFLPSTNSTDNSKVLLVFVTPTATAANHDSQPAESAAPNDAAIEAAKLRLSNAKQAVVALLMFAADNQDQIPPTIGQTASYLNGDWAQRFETNFDLVYTGARSNIANPAETILLKEKQPQEMNGAWNKAYGFADGHAEIHREPNGDFEAFEKEHSIPPANEQ